MVIMLMDFYRGGVVLGSHLILDFADRENSLYVSHGNISQNTLTVQELGRLSCTNSELITKISMI
jgi:hypothetical protein